ncbi:HprK-related kinase A [Rubrivivax gelatinosus]|uniref:Hpr(Ser) kinase/phosphatase n=1 Tax=Rubrivivax gelatinosus TaxID=28068 RepID=A0A4R2MXX6_RUBGE|nr:HprK-related kinase A [Rubrivivax gelatinosus]MBK1686138.1 HprK-related kinase A [Rubrivivax gelatinosus]TCP05633.1 Hpr(Ser) kinase/phosphatase [Rubrivivax gelatinosus]
MKVSDLDRASLLRRLRADGLRLDILPFVACVRSGLPAVADAVALLYADFPLAPQDGFVDYHLEIRASRFGLPGRRRARFVFDGLPAFVSLPANQAPTMLEWGLNWCVAAHAHQFLVCHAAVLERDGRALVLPAPPGSGKSTLTAVLAHRGWRLLSDELALLDPATGLVHGMARAVNLKNASIGLVAGFVPEAVISPPVPDTLKGTIALMRPPAQAVSRRAEPARPAWVVLPRWQAGARAAFERIDRAEAALLLAEQSFNYHVLGLQGFDALTTMVGHTACLRFSYGALDELAPAFDALAAGDLP